MESGIGQPPVVPLRSTILASPTMSIRSRRARLLTSAAARLRSTDLLSAFRTASATFAACGLARPAPRLADYRLPPVIVLQ